VVRTTITLDDDLAVQLEQRRIAQGMTFKEVVNAAIRAGLPALERCAADRQGEVTTTRPLPLGQRLIGDIDNVADALAVAEGEQFH
jgi:Arc/MetJ family transcription regulator